MKEMKDSRIKWVKEVPSNWTISPFKYLLTENRTKNSQVVEKTALKFTYGEIVHKDNFDVDKDPSLSDTLATYTVVQPNDIAINGLNLNYDFISQRIGLVKENGVITSAYLIVRVNERTLEPSFVNYVLKSYDNCKVLHSIGKGVRQTLNFECIGDLSVCYPSKDKQKAIATYLDRKCSAIDTAISHIQKQIENLEEYKKSVITQAVTKGLDPNVKMKDSGVEWIGEIPEGWKVGKMKNIADTSHPYAIGDGDHGLIKNTDYKDSGIPYIRVLNLTWGYGLNKGNLVYISEEKNALIKNSELHPNDVLVAKTGATIGKTAIIPDDMPRANTTAHVGKVTISPKHSPKFYYYVLQSDPLQRQIAFKSSLQATRPELGNEGLANLIIPVASLKVEQVIAQYLDEKCASINEAIAKQHSLIDKMNEYKQSVIYNAVTGKINCTT